jgi:hypothetical protein
VNICDPSQKKKDKISNLKFFCIICLYPLKKLQKAVKIMFLCLLGAELSNLNE